MHLDGEDLRQRPLSERRALLEQLLAEADSPRLVFSRGFEGEGKDVFAAIEQLELEGIVSKRASGIYRSGKKSGWVKVKSFAVGTYDVIGVDKTPGGAPVALLADGGRYMGQAFIALPASLRDPFWRFIEREARPTSPVAGQRKKTATWVNAGMVAKVKHLRGEEMLRHATVIEITLPKARKSRSDAPTPRSPVTRPARER
jgi:bifunctional non-homologous end joining protein LigD